MTPETYTALHRRGLVLLQQIQQLAELPAPSLDEACALVQLGRQFQGIAGQLRDCDALALLRHIPIDPVFPFSWRSSEPDPVGASDCAVSAHLERS